MLGKKASSRGARTPAENIKNNDPIKTAEVFRDMAGEEFCIMGVISASA